MQREYFTLEEAQAALPRIREWMGEARELKRRSEAKVALWREGVEGGLVEMALVRGQVEYLLAEAGRRLESIREMGCQVKDIEEGLVDFPAWIPGQGDVLLCWRLGEERVGFWHHLSEGFSSRRPIESSSFSLRKFS